LNSVQDSGPRTSPGRRIYAVGDSHGCLDRLRALHRAIADDSAASDAADCLLVHLGDYIDRGPQSAELLDYLMQLSLPGFEIVNILGNHEDYALKVIDDPLALPVWLENGGDTTLRSYGLPLEDYDARFWRYDKASLMALHGAYLANFPESHRAFLAGMPLSFRDGDYYFCHAGIRPGVPLPEQKRDDLLWIRGPFLDSARDHGAIVVHGHTPVSTPDIATNRIGIDTGAVYGGMLTCLVLDGAAQRFIQV